MSSDEDFSLVSDPPSPPSEESLEGIKALINNYQKKYSQLIREQQDLVASRDDQREMAEKFKRRSVKLTEDLKKDWHSHKEQIENKKAELSAMGREVDELEEEIRRVEEDLWKEEAENARLKEETAVFSNVPEKPVVFAGATGSGGDAFDMKSRVTFPMDGGTLLITFEEEAVARKIVEMKTHRVELGSDPHAECCVTVEARPVHLMLPRLVEIESAVSPRHVLISELPEMEADALLSKLEIHFSKSRHGGGEVDSCEMMHDSGLVVIGFVEEGIAKRLTEGGTHHKVQLQGKNVHKVRVTPFLNGKITNFELKKTLCPRTVLLTGIPPIMEWVTLQDLMEIHFQKRSNGGGEIGAIHYNPLGQLSSVLFESVSKDEERE